MPLGTEVGLGPGAIVLDGDPAPSENEYSSPPLFGPCLLWPNVRQSQQLLSSCFTFFLGSPTARADGLISTSYDVLPRKEVFFGVAMRLLHFHGVKFPERHFRGVNRHFQA